MSLAVRTSTGADAVTALAGLVIRRVQDAELMARIHDRALLRLPAAADRLCGMIGNRRYDVVVIGGGQAGLAMGHYLAQAGLEFIILDAGERTGEVWRKRWDSLTLFTPAAHCALPGMSFPAPPAHLPSKDEVASYLTHYARFFALPIAHGARAVSLTYISEWSGFRIDTTEGTLYADQVVVATGPFQTPVLPSFASAVAPGTRQLHSSEYRSAAELPHGDVLVIGAGNSGVQIASELARTRRTWLSVGASLPTLPARIMGRSVFWWLETTGLMSVSVLSRIGRAASTREYLIGTSPQAAARDAGVLLAGRTTGTEGGIIYTSDGAAIEPATIIWATGFRQDFSWIKAPVFDHAGRPRHVRGITSVRGLYFLGLPWLHTRGSALLGYIGRDAAHLARAITA